MLSRRTKALFWAVIVAVVALGLRQVFAIPTQPSASSNSPVVISEFVASNGGELADEDGDFADWIELHNRTSSTVNLEGWALTDDPSQPDKWTFRSTLLKPDERIIVFASGKNRRKLEPEEGRPNLHTSFRLDADGGFLALYPPTSRRYLDASEYVYAVQQPGVSYGVLPDQPVVQENMRYFEQPTPGARNDASSAWTAALEPVEIVPSHGVYTEPLEVDITHPDAQADIRYTTDGSAPTESSPRYTEPIRITSTTPLRAAAFRHDMRRSTTATQTYIIVDDVLSQSDSPPGFPATLGVHTVDIGGYQVNTPRQVDYGMDPDIVGDGSAVALALTSLPSISLVMDIADFETLYANPRERGVAWERPVSIELINPDSSEAGFQQDAGLRIQGGAGRWEFMPKHSFRLFFKQQYGASKLDYPMFPDSPVASFDTLVLRSGVDRSFAGHPSTPELPVNHRDTAYLRDEWTRASQIAMSNMGSHGAFAHLYINGLYWGLYNIIERPDASFAAQHLGGDKDRWFSVNHGGAVSGQPDRFHVLLDLARQGDLDDPQRYATMLEFIDPVQFSDYLILNWYAGNYDWPANNWYVDVENPAGRNFFFVWDAEGVWENGAEINLGPDSVDGAPYPNVVKLVHQALHENPEFNLIFADRLYKHLHHDGALTDENSQARWMDLAGRIEAAIPAESARWGDVRYEDPITLEDWRSARDNVWEQMEGNAAKLLDLAREAGYYPAIDPPHFSQQGGVFESSLTLTMSLPSQSEPGAEIYYTIDGSDPRAPETGEPAGSLYTEPVQLNGAVTVKARVFDDGQWSALNEAHFRRPGQRAELSISEIMYHPIGDDEAEFIEIANLGEDAADLSRAYLEGVDYRFPDDAKLGPGERIVLVRDLKRFRSRYPNVEVFGIYGGKLSNKGERLSLIARNGETIFTVQYDDEGGWPLSAGGAGDSIVLKRNAEDPSLPSSWQASADKYGSPGEPDQSE